MIAPLHVGLDAQMHHHFQSRFLIDTLFAVGYCSSYSAVLTFKDNANAFIASDVLSCSDLSDMMVLFAADNVYHNIMSLDGKHKFHGMGMIAAMTPRHHYEEKGNNAEYSERADFPFEHNCPNISGHRTVQSHEEHMLYYNISKTTPTK